MVNTSHADARPELGDIRTEWYRVKPALEELLAANKHLQWRPTHIYTECYNGEADLWLVPEGFAITKAVTDTWSGRRRLLVWIGYTYKRGSKAFLKYLNYFDDVAKELGCQDLEIWSDVAELEPYYTGALGFEVMARAYVREVV